MANNTQETTTLSGALKLLGGVAGFVFGAGIGAEDPEIGFFIGALVGAAMGAIGGWFVGKTLEVVFHIAFIVVALAIIGLRIFGVFNFIAG